MKKIKKWMLASLAGIMMISSLTACGSNQGKTVAVIQGEKIPESLYRTYLWNAQQFFERLSGPTVWEMEIEGKKMEDIAKERALESVVLSIVTTQKAEELGIKLTKEQKKSAKENAEEFVKANPDIISLQGLETEDIEDFLLSIELSDAVRRKLSENYLPSEEEIATYIEQNKLAAEEVSIEHVLLNTVDENMQPLPSSEITKKQELAKEVLQKALNGESMQKLADQYSEDPNFKNNQGKETFGRGTMAPEFEKAAFDGKDGEVWPEVVETSRGYHIIKVISHTTDKEKMKETYIEAAKSDFANSEFQDLIKNATVEKTQYYEEVKVIKASENKEAQPVNK